MIISLFMNETPEGDGIRRPARVRERPGRGGRPPGQHAREQREKQKRHESSI
jgi:hypothetical protein